MSCFPELTYAIYADGELPAEEARAAEAHLAVCARCRTLVEALRAENRLLAEVLPEAEAEMPGVARPARPLDLLWAALPTLAAAAGLQAILDWVGELSPPGGVDWLNPFGLGLQMTLLFNGVFYFVEEGAAMLFSNFTTISVVVLGALLLGGGVLLLRRRPGTVTVLVTLALVLGLAPSVAALEKRTGTNITVPKGQTVDDTLLARGDTINIDGVVTGNLIAFGNRVAIKGTVQGDVICFARSVEVDGTVGGNVYGFAQWVNLRGQVARSVNTFTQRFQLDPDARVDADIIAFAEEANLDGTVGRDVSTYAKSTDVRGTVGRNLIARSERVTLLAPARVGGNLTAYVPREDKVHIDPGATVAGTTKTHVAKERASRYVRPKFYFWQAVRLVAAFLTGLLVFWLFPVLFGARLETAGAFLRTVGVGFLVLVATPVAAIIAGITLIGLPIALLSLAAWLAALYLAKILVAAFVGEALLRAGAGQPGQFALNLLVGLLIVYAAINVPYVGGWIHFLAMLLGFGAAVMQVLRWRQQPQPAA